MPTTSNQSNSNLRVQSSLLLSTEQNSLIEPSEVTVSVKSVLTAEPVLTPLGKYHKMNYNYQLFYYKICFFQND